MTIGLRDYLKSKKASSLKHRIKNLRYELKYAWQRAWYGYDCMDWIEMFACFTERYKSLLKEYKENHYGLFNVPEEYRDVFNKYFFDEVETDVIIDTMIYHLEMMNEDYVEKLLYGKNTNDYSLENIEEFNEYLKNNTIEKMKCISSIVNQNKEAFMELFNLFFYDLWD